MARLQVGVNDLGTVRPDLAVQLVNPDDSVTVTVSGGRKLRWFCLGTDTTPHPRREWDARVSDRSSGNGCAVCSGRAVLVGFNDLATVRPDLAVQLVNPDDAQTVTVSSNRKLRWFCLGTNTTPHPRREWDTTVDKRSRGNGCAVCAGRVIIVGFNDLATVQPDLAVQLVNPNDAQTVTVSSGRKLRWFCLGTVTTPHPRREWDTTVNKRSNGRGCAVCAGRAIIVGFNDLATVRPDLAVQLVNPDDAVTVTVSGSRKLRWFCLGTNTTPHPRREWDAAVADRSNGNGCAACAKHGFDPAKPAWLYRFTFRDGGTPVQVFGITGDYDRRMREYGKLYGVGNMDSVWFPVGADAQFWESQILAELAESTATPVESGVVGTARESFCLDEDGWEFSTVFEALWSAAVTQACADSLF